MVFDVPYTSKTSPVIHYFLPLLAKVDLDQRQVLKKISTGESFGPGVKSKIKLKQPNFLKVNIKSK